MNGTSRAETSSHKSAPRPEKFADSACFTLFLIALTIVWLRTAFGIKIPGHEFWPDAALIVSAAISMLFSLLRRLPAQNVLLAAGVIGVGGAAVHILNAATSIPFGPMYYANAGPRLFNTVPWTVPLLWIVVIVSSRGTARLILRPWRKTRTYGFRHIALTAVLAALFNLGLEPFATRLNQYWLWNPTRLPIDWYGAPVTTFVGWMLSTILLLAFATPALVKKRPNRASVRYQSALMWTLLNFVFISGALAHQLWLGAIVSTVVTITVATFAIRGARW